MTAITPTIHRQLCELVRGQAKAYFIKESTEEQQSIQAFGMTDLPLIKGYMALLKGIVGDQIMQSKGMTNYTSLEIYDRYITKEQNSDYERHATLGFMSAVKMVA